MRLDDDQRGAKPRRHGREYVAANQNERAAQRREFVAAKAGLQSDADQEGDRDRQHHHVVHEEIGRGQQRAGSKRSGLQCVRHAASPHQRQHHRNGGGEHPLERPGQLFGAAEITHHREDALQLPPCRLALGQEGLRESRHPVKERQPALGAEGEPGNEDHRDRRYAGADEHAPMPGCDQHDRKQQPVLRLVRQQPEADAGKHRTYRDQIERAADQRRGKKTVLSDQRIDERHRNGEREQKAEVAADDRAHDDKIRHDADQDPAEIRHRIGKLRQHGCDEQERRRIVPGKVADKILTELRDLDLLLDVPVIGLCRKAIEHQTPGSPDVDEIGRDAETVRIVNPPVRKIRHHAKRQVHHAQRKAHPQEPRRNLAVAPARFRGWSGRRPCEILARERLLSEGARPKAISRPELKKS